MLGVKRAWSGSAVKKTLDDYAPGTRRLFLWSEICGWVVVSAAVTLDLLGQWPHWTFVPNLINTFGGFLIGVPVALVLFTTLTNERENNRSAKSFHTPHDNRSSWSSSSRNIRARTAALM
jgi:hypothetical protein